MKTTTWCGAVLALAALAAAPEAGAQEARVEDRGWKSVAVSTTGDLGVGLWFRVGNRTDLGVTTVLGYNKLDLEGDQEADMWSVDVAPALRMYTGQVGPVQPYTEVGAFFGRSEASTTPPGAMVEIANTATRFGGSLAVGAEWFPTARLALGGHVGVQGGVEDIAFESTDGQQVSETEADGWFIRTFNSGVTLRLFL